MATSWPRAVLLTRSRWRISLKKASKLPTHLLWASNSATSRNAGIFSRLCSSSRIASGFNNDVIFDGEALGPLDIGTTPFQFLSQYFKIRMLFRCDQLHGSRGPMNFHFIAHLHP